MRAYRQLTQEHRSQIQALLRAGQNQTEIAEVLSVHKSTISRERRRCRGLRGYRPSQAQQLMNTRRREWSHPRIMLETWSHIESQEIRSRE